MSPKQNSWNKRGKKQENIKKKGDTKISKILNREVQTEEQMEKDCDTEKMC